MTSTLTQTDIANMALDILHEGPIGSLEDDDPNARRMKRNFSAWRDSFLAMHNWNFATERASLPADSVAPAYGWAKRYLVPGDCLRVLPITKDGNFEGAKIRFQVEGQYILTDQTAPLRVLYIKRITDFGLWSPVTVSAFAAYMASKISHAVTGKASYAELAARLFREEYSEAKRVDGLQGTIERPDYSNVIDAR